MKYSMWLSALALISSALVTGCSSPPRPQPYTVYKSSDAPSDREWVPPPLWAPGVAEPSSAAPADPVSEVESAQPVLQSSISVAPATEPLSEVVEDARRLGQLGDQDGMLAKLELAASQGSADAHYELAKVYADGKLNGGNRSLVAEHLQASADLGNPEALRVLAWQLLRSDGEPSDRERGTAMMIQAAQRSVRAQRELGMLYLGAYKPSLNDPERGLDYLRGAAAAGDVEAAGQLNKALNRLGRTTAATDVEASLQADAPGGSADRESGEQLYERGSAMLAKGGSAENQARAYALFDMAYHKGHQMAGVELRMLSGLKAEMDRREPGWLARYQSEALGNR